MFATVTVLIGKLSADMLAGHQIALTVVTTTFMMPLGISSAAAVRVGHAIGRRDPRRRVALRMDGAGVWRERDVGWRRWCCSASRNAIARLFTPEAAIIAAAAPLLRVAAFFQLFDGLQSDRDRSPARRGRHAHADGVPFRRVLDIWACRWARCCVFASRWARWDCGWACRRG